ncbi:MAG: carbohydrate ABC transporter permease [Lachnospiraceae bacterium]|jgi:multiple sugar transport system permease protein
MGLYDNCLNDKKKLYFRNGCIILGLSIFAIATVFPIYFMLVSSFGPPVEAGANSYSLWPKKWTLDSFKFFFNYSEYSVRWLINSLIVSVTIMISNVLFASLAGYAFSKIKFKGSNVLFYTLLCAMMIPTQVTQVPLYILLVNVFNLQNTYSALILPGLCGVYNIFLCKQFMAGIPKEIIECAKIEGASQPQIYMQIILPLSKTVLAVMAITTFMDSWNAFFWPFLVTNTMSMQTIQVGLKNFSFANTTYFAPMMAGATVAAVPMFILFFSLQKYFLEGVTVGAVKG